MSFNVFSRSLLYIYLNIFDLSDSITYNTYLISVLQLKDLRVGQ